MNEFNESHFKILKSTIHGAGKGLFSKVHIKSGETIGRYTGRVLTDYQVNRAPYCHSDYILWICQDHNILGEGKLANYTRYINHSEQPNSRIVVSTRWKTARIEAIDVIKPSEEIFIDYGPAYWEAKAFKL